MGAFGRGLARGALLLAVLGTAACVHYPTVTDIGGIRLRPEHGRAVRQPAGALFYVDIINTGKFGDVLLAVTAPVARRAQLVDTEGRPLDRLAVPGTGVVSLRPGGAHALLSELTHELQPGESIIVTLAFQKSGSIGVVTVVE